MLLLDLGLLSPELLHLPVCILLLLLDASLFLHPLDAQGIMLGEDPLLLGNDALLLLLGLQSAREGEGEHRILC